MTIEFTQHTKQTPALSSLNLPSVSVLPSQTFHNKTIWLTGASVGIGAALATYLAARGARLILSSRRPALLNEIKNGLANSHLHHVVPLDLEQPEGISSLAQQTVEDIGSIDILINKAGIAQCSLVLETQLAVDRRIMEVNFFGTVAMTKAILPFMLKTWSRPNYDCEQYCRKTRVPYSQYLLSV